MPYCSYSAAGTGGLTGSSVLVRVDQRPGSANSGSYATIADLEPLYARPCGSRASYYAASHITHVSQVRKKLYNENISIKSCNSFTNYYLNFFFNIIKMKSK